MTSEQPMTSETTMTSENRMSSENPMTSEATMTNEAAMTGEPSPSRRRDRGFTLPEVLISMMISGILIVSITMAFTTVLRAQEQAGDRLAESKDITFVQTWVPVDLASALATFDASSDDQLLADLAAANPPMSIRALQPGEAGLPGINVLTVVRPDLEAGSGVYYLVSYRYHEVNGVWRVSRFEIRNPGTVNESIKSVGVAHEVPAPPPGWDPTTPPRHAVEVTARNQMILRPIGENVTFTFNSGNTFISGGGGLSAENFLPPDGSGALRNPTAPPSRCGGRMALVIDSSGSVAPYATQARNAAKGFIDSFTGTPYSITMAEFGDNGWGLLTPTGRQRNRAPYVSLLNGGTAVNQLKTRIDAIAFTGATNWEDGLRVPVAAHNSTKAGVPYGVDQPDLLVFITDGDPNRIRSATGTSVSAGMELAADDAAVVANRARQAGTEMVGVFVGAASTDSASIKRLSRVLTGINTPSSSPLPEGQLWNGWVNPDGTVEIGNARTARIFRGSFDQLGGVLRTIMIAECGGTLTVQKRIETAPGVVESPATGQFTFVADSLERVLDRSITSSVTFDYTFPPGVGTRDVELRETTPGYRFLRAECTAGGSPITVTPLGDGTPGARVPVGVDRAVSCLMISEAM
jgi:prepilin-type N-terminal cleavage/methylation domain-containing protein